MNDSTGTPDIIPELRNKDVEELPSGAYPDELRGKTAVELEQFVTVLDAQLRSIHQTDEGEIRDKTPEEQKAFAYGLKLRELAVARIDEDRAVREVLGRRPKAVVQAIAATAYRTDDPFGSIRGLSVPEARDRALRTLDDRGAAGHLRSDEKDHVERQIRKSTDIARRILVTENDAYRSAWQKLVTDPHAAATLSDEERNAMRSYAEYRAASEGTNTSGGFGIPVFIDPSIIMTAQGTDNPFLTLARQVDVNTNQWKGVSSAGVTWSFDAEASEVSDDTATLAQPTVPVFMARGFIPYSIEVGQDYPGFANEMQTLLASGYDELLVDKLTRGAGTGSGEPNGILTALSANTNVRVALTTGGSLGAADPYKVWQALPQRFRRKASWLMSVATNDSIRQLGTANVYHAYTVNLPDEWADSLFRRGVYESPYMPDTTTSTTATIGLAVVGDFSNYVIARRGGMSVELIQNLVGTNHRPTGSRGWFAYSRIGGGSANDLGFRLLTNV
jgi:HK97 family phage major capsid protein